MSEDVQLPPELADELGMNDTPETFIAELDTLREEIAATATDDLQLLADVHTRMQKLRDRLAEVPGVEDDVQEAAARQADKAATLLEALILNDTDNAEALLEDVSATAMIVQCVLDGTCPPDAAMADADAEGADTSAIAADPNGGDFSTFQQALSDDGDEEDDDDADYVPASFPTATLPEITMAPAAAPAPTAAADAPADDLTPFAIDAEDAPLCAEFVTEANGHLEQAEQDLLTLEDDPTNKDAIDSCFRAFHTIKGVAGFLNLKQVQELAHATENLLDRGREGKLQLTGTASDLVLASLDLMKQLVADIDSGSGGSPITPRTGVAQQAQWCNDFVDAVERGENPNIDVKRPSDTVAEEAPTEERRAGEDRRKDDRRSSGDGTVKVNTDRLDSLIDMVGELVIAQSMVSQDVAGLGETDQRLGRNLGHLGKIVRELQDLSMSLRMVQVGNVFRKMQRVVRDTARKIDKQVELVITGGDTELDRNVVDALADPLVHMVRNSVDHGIETPAERADFGKNPVGTVELKAYHKGGSIHIEIRDDGKGLDVDKIKAKAVKNGVMTQVEADAMPDSEAFKLVFGAGLSTAAAVTDISGRGVGMDVVKRNIESLRGQVDITSELGAGSVFTIRLPLTLAVIDGLLVKVGGEKFILPITSIEQSLRPKPEQLSTVQGRGELVNCRGALLPLVRLHRMFGIEPTTQRPDEALVVIVTDNERRVCILVDELLGQEQVVIKNLGAIGSQPGISGGAVLGDGNVSLILDVPGLIASAGDSAGESAAPMRIAA